MKHVIVLGAGRIGRCIAEILSEGDEISVTLADQSLQALSDLSTQMKTCVLDVKDEVQLANALRGNDIVVSACQFTENPLIARIALTEGLSYFDLTEDVKTTKAIRELSVSAKEGQVFVPQCGLAPGFVGILASALAQQFDELDTLKLRVGALPEVPSNAMLYNLTWSTEGLINEYCNRCDAIKNGSAAKVLALEGLETFALDGSPYEAFNTSGGLGTLCETLQGRVRDLTYKTIRYPGHRHLMNFLINGLRLGEEGERRQLLQKIIEDAVPVTTQDEVIILVSATGQIDGKLVQLTEHHRVRHGCAFHEDWSAIQITTAASACVVVDLFLRNQLSSAQKPMSGFIAQEDISYEAFMQSPLAKPYRETARLWTPQLDLEAAQ